MASRLYRSSMPQPTRAPEVNELVDPIRDQHPRPNAFLVTGLRKLCDPRGDMIVRTRAVLLHDLLRARP